MQPHVTAGGAPAATIYALVCPHSGRVRYVGQTIQPLTQRFGQHLRHPTLAGLAVWFRALAEEGKAPVLCALEVVPGEQRLSRERFWLAEMRRRGEPILNLTRGGQGSAPRPSPVVLRMCENCGEGFCLTLYCLRRGQRFCSVRCQAQYRHRRKVRTCATCGRRFRCKDAERVHHGKKYCSQECYFANRGTVEERFWANVERSEDCWLWLGWRDPKFGAGRMTVGNRAVSAARVSWEIHFGALAPGLRVGRRCESANCVRPEHLFAGTIAEITAEKVRKGRQARGERTRPETRAKGERSARAVLEEANVLEIRRRYAAGGVTQTALAEQFGICQVEISAIVRGKTWRHLPIT